MSQLSKSLPPRFNVWHRLPHLSVMDRYLTSELTMPFLFGVGAFSILGLSAGAMFELIRRVTESGLPMAVAIEVLLLKYPEWIVYAFPMATLLATLMAYSRLASDSELVALRGCGISVYRLVLPAVLFCCVITGLTFAFNEMIVPASNFRATVTLEKALKRERPTFQEQNILYQEFEEVEREDGGDERVLQRLFYAREFNGQEMQGLTILDFSQRSLNQIISARSATWNDSTNTWDFKDGTIYVVSSDGSFRNIVKFKEQQLQLPREPLDIASKKRDYNEMNIAQAVEYLDLIRDSGNEDKIRELRVRIHQKYALPFICVAFGLVGSALGAVLRKTGRATSFALSIVIAFSYYLLAFVFGAIAQTGTISPLIGAWLPNLFGLLAGGLLLYRAAR